MIYLNNRVVKIIYPDIQELMFHCTCGILNTNNVYNNGIWLQNYCLVNNKQCLNCIEIAGIVYDKKKLIYFT